MNVLVIDEMSEETRAGLNGLGLVLTYEPDLQSHALASVIGDTQVLVTGKTRVTRSAIEAGSRLQAILRAGVGVDVIDTQAASERGIIVSDCGNADINARAELAIGLVLALDRGLQRGPGGASGLRGRTFGIHGWDPVAPVLAKIAQGFGMRVLVAAKALTPTLAAEAGVHWADTADALYKRADIVSLHPEDPAELLATATRIALLHDAATLVDVAGRGHIDLAAAAERLNNKTLRLGLDAYDANDYGDDVPFAADLGPQLAVTFRQAGKTRQVDEVVAHQVVSALESFLTERTMPGTQNLGPTRGAAALLIRHLPGPEVLAAVFETLKDADFAVNNVESRSFSGGHAALLRVALPRVPGADLVSDLESLSGVLGVVVES
jgi:D-3-phosphoglycerate dehydrogenase